MAQLSDFPVGSKVSFKAGPTRVQVTDAEVTGSDNGFLVTKDAAGKERKVRVGAIQGLWDGGLLAGVAGVGENGFGRGSGPFL